MRARLASLALAVASLAVFAALTAAAVWGSFSADALSNANTISAAADFRAPTSTARTIAKTAGGLPGFIKKSGTYYVYANVTDTGNPASGVSTVKANVSTITSGSTAVTLSAGTFTVDGVTYNRRSASLTAASGLIPGSLPYSLTMTDVAGNSRTEAAFTVDVDNTAPAASDVQTINTGTAGLAQIGDKVVYTYSEAPDPNSILAGWSGVSTPIVVRLNQATTDTVTVYNSGNSKLLPLGTINLARSDYTTANRTFGASGTASTMVLSGSTITVTLGTQSGAATTAAGTGAMAWTPAAGATDWAGNATSTTARTESGSADKDF